MTDNENSSTSNIEERQKIQHSVSPARDGGVSGGIYGLAFIGAAIYFIQHAATFWMGVLGFLKALIWPAVLIYNLLEFLKM